MNVTGRYKNPDGSGLRAGRTVDEIHVEASKRELKVKRKYYSWLGSYQTGVPIVISTKFPATMMVLRVMSNESDFQPEWEKKVWPPILPNSNPLDYFACGVTESRVNPKPHNKIED
jgi:hypothetical protein